uniref:Uncharacterized protein n=1 Tax=Arundo donax TaxID=35708 RepID=A0A0A9CHZ9_ARUDO
MAMVPSDSSHHGVVENGPNEIIQGRCGEAGQLGASWYFSRKDIEENSPSRRDGVDLKKESYLRRSYCSFLQDLGMKLRGFSFAICFYTTTTSLLVPSKLGLARDETRGNQQKGKATWLEMKPAGTNKRERQQKGKESKKQKKKKKKKERKNEIKSLSHGSGTWMAIFHALLSMDKSLEIFHDLLYVSIFFENWYIIF